MALMRPLYLNGRFLTQATTGVQRFAGEITAALDRRYAPGDTWAPAMLVPRSVSVPPTLPSPSRGKGEIDAAAENPLPPGGGGKRGGAAPGYRALRVQPVGRFVGHLWEQVELPRHARGGVLVNLANAAPIIAAGRQLVVLHDAGIFAHPEAYSLAYRLAHGTLDRTLARSRARLATVSRFSRDELAQHLHISASDIAVIPEGADHILRTAPDPAVLARHGLAPGRYVLAVGSLVAHKNLGALGALATMLSGRGLDLAIAGAVAPGVFAGDIALPRPARYLGRVSDGALRALYEAALCLVFPSRYEGFGIPPVEAMACRCPVIAATAGAVVETCGDAALYADPDDPSGIAAAVARVIDEPGMADALRERGRARVRDLTWDNAAAALARLIEQVQQESSEHRDARGDRP